MARKPNGIEHLDAAKMLLKKAITADELRSAQAFAFPLMFDCSIKQTAEAIGRSVSVTSKMRNNCLLTLEGEKISPRSKKELRNRAHASPEEEALLLTEVLSLAGKDSSASKLKPLIEVRLGKSISLRTVYNMLERHEQRKREPVKKPSTIQRVSEYTWEEQEIGDEAAPYNDDEY